MLADPDGATGVVSAADGVDVGVGAVVLLGVADSDGDVGGELLRLGDVVSDSSGVRERVGLGSDAVRDGSEVAVGEAVGDGRSPVSSPPQEASDRTTTRPKPDASHAHDRLIPVSTTMHPVCPRWGPSGRR